MSASAIRLIACAGALATGLLLAGAGAGVSVADPGDPTSGGNEGATAAGTDANPDGGSAGSEAKPDNERPATTFGSGRDDNDVKPSPKDDVKPSLKDEVKKPEPSVGTWPKFKNSLSIPILRIPTPEEVTATRWPDPSVFFGTLEVPVPSIDGFWSALSQPEPQPTPSPAFRGQQEAPVIDVTGGGSDGSMAADNNAAPPVFELPLVVAPAVPIRASSAHSAAARFRPRRSADGRRRPDRRCRREGAVDPRIVVIDRGNSEDDHDTYERAGHPGGLSAGPSQPDGRSARRRCAAGRGRIDVFHVQRRRHRIPAGQQHPIHPHHGRGAVPLTGPLGARRCGPHTCASPHRQTRNIAGDGRSVHRRTLILNAETVTRPTNGFNR